MLKLAAIERSGPTESSPPARAAWVALGLGLAFAAAYGAAIVARPPDRYLEFLSYYVYQAAPVATLALAFLPVLRTRGVERAGWIALAVLLATWTAGDMMYTYYNLRFGEDPPFPGLTDVLYYAGYLAFLAGLAVLAFPRERVRDTRWLVDAAIIMAAVGSVSWTFILEPIVQDSGYSPRDAAIAMGYPVFDFALVALAVVAMYAGGGRVARRTLLLMLSAVTLGISDSVYTYMVSTVGYDSTANPTDPGYILAYVFLAACFVLPPEREEHATVTHQSLTGLLLPYAVAAAMLVITVAQSVREYIEEVLLFGSATVVALVIARQFMTLAENLRLYRELGQASEARRSLLDKVVRAQEDERHRLTLELHDGPVQALSFLATRIGAARKFAARGEGERAGKILGEVESALSHEVQGLRELMTELRPPSLEERGLVEAIRDFAQVLLRDAGVRLRVEGAIPQRPPAATESMLYRVAQEALTNVRKHAGAGACDVTFTASPGQLDLEVRDDGKGFDVRAVTEGSELGHYGMLGITERTEMLGGSCAWDSAPGAGTAFRVSVPLADGALREAA
jgi:signal transduction histidine kinase